MTGGGERAVTQVEQHDDVVATLVGDGQVGLSVAVQVGRRNPEGNRARSVVLQPYQLIIPASITLLILIAF